MQGILAVYMIANAKADGAGQGFITVALAVIGFIVKKCMLQFADPINLETAMLIAGALANFGLEGQSCMLHNMYFTWLARFCSVAISME